MRQLLTIAFSFVLFSISFAQENTKADILGEPFWKKTFVMNDDYQGKVTSTLVGMNTDNKGDKAVLYIHGYNDYFFQKEMALKLDSAGFNFFALDLRKYGRSMLPDQTPFEVRNLDEYYADIDSALHYIKSQNIDNIILMAHSTGGLTVPLYASEHRDDKDIKALILNSPFFDMNQSWTYENIIIPAVSFFGRYFPDIEIPQGASTGYAESLLKEYQGEWDYDTNLKKTIAQPLTTGWIHAIHSGQMKLQKGLDLKMPILVMCSDSSFVADEWTPDFWRADVVLDVNDIVKYASCLGDDVEVVQINGGIHDLILSPKAAREEAYKDIFSFLNQIGL